MTDEKDKSGEEIEFVPETPAAGEGEAPQAAAVPPAPAAEEPEAKAAAESSRHLRGEAQKKGSRAQAPQEGARRPQGSAPPPARRHGESAQALRAGEERVPPVCPEQHHARAPGHRRQFRAGPPEPSVRRGRENVPGGNRAHPQDVPDLLSKQGVRPIELKDRTFDPNFHHAMTVEESDEVEEPTRRRGTPERLHAPRPPSPPGPGQSPRPEERE